MTLRPLTIDEIAALSARGCTASDWGRVSVAEPFDPTHYRDVAFAGTIHLGKNDTTAATHVALMPDAAYTTPRYAM